MPATILGGPTACPRTRVKTNPKPQSESVRRTTSSIELHLSNKFSTAVRVRPPLPANDPGLELIPVRFRGNTCAVANTTTLTVQSAQGKKLFLFDRVFGDSCTQQGIWDYISDSVNSFVQGYNVSILAYGQSGAGKSYTMGTASPGEQPDQTTWGMLIFPQRKTRPKTDPSSPRYHPSRRYRSFRETVRRARRQARVRHPAPFPLLVRHPHDQPGSRRRRQELAAHCDLRRDL